MTCLSLCAQVIKGILVEATTCAAGGVWSEDSKGGRQHPVSLAGIPGSIPRHPWGRLGGDSTAVDQAIFWRHVKNEVCLPRRPVCSSLVGLSLVALG